MSSWKKSCLFWVALTLSVVACGCGDSQRSAPAAERKPEDDLEVSSSADIGWIDANTLLLRADYPRRDWVVRRDTGQVFRLRSFGDHAPIDASPDGAWLLTRSGDGSALEVLRVQDVLGGDPAVQRVEIPPFPEMEPERSKQNVTFAFWLNDGRALAVRRNPLLEYEQCSIYDPQDRTVTPAPHCLQDLSLAGTGAANRVVGLGDDQYAFYSADEGTIHVSIVRFTLESGVTGVRRELRYDALGLVDVYRDARNDVLYLSSRVALSPDGGYATRVVDFPPRGPATLYRLTPDAGFVRTDQKIPYRGALRSIASGDVAWIAPERAELCTASPEETRVCHPLPAALRPNTLW